VSFARKIELEQRHGVNLEGPLAWAFEFEGQDWFAGFRVLASNGVDLPVLNIFRMFARMGSMQIEGKSSGQLPLDALLKGGVRGEPDVGVLGSANEDGRVVVMVWHHHDDGVMGPGRFDALPQTSSYRM
jgi:xylan 1,4-beta-xylosidase